MDDLNLPCTHVVVSTPPNLSPSQDFTIFTNLQTPTTPCGGGSSTSAYPDFHSLPYYQKPVKKRAKWIKIDENDHGVRSSGVSIAKPKAKYTKKPDPNAPKITAPCTVCGRKFWSWKALFGHMRCHPERQWRGINPPSNLRTGISVPKLSGSSSHDHHQFKMSMKDQEAADWLLMLANSPGASDSPTITNVCNVVNNEAMCMEDDSKVVVRSPPLDDTCPPGGFFGRFECSSCKKVFGSHQALGGHRASHRNVKGCFANAKNDNDDEVYVHAENVTEDVSFEAVEDRMIRASGHQCGICLRVFSSGQALGGHKRCHWEKGDEALGFTQSMVSVPVPVSVSAAREGYCWDLNLPAPLDDGASCSYSSATALDLRLGL